jgi:hypothetical protein
MINFDTFYNNCANLRKMLKNSALTKNNKNSISLYRETYAMVSAFCAHKKWISQRPLISMYYNFIKKKNFSSINWTFEGTNQKIAKTPLIANCKWRILLAWKGLLTISYFIKIIFLTALKPISVLRL